MKSSLFLILFFCFTISLPAQNIPVAQAGGSLKNAKTSDEIASYINLHYHSDADKVLAIYSWIVSNIKYNADSIHYVILDEDNQERVTWALRRRAGVCENFAAIFADLCTKCGIRSFAIQGFTKAGGYLEKGAHVWNAALIDNKWNLYDATWDAGSGPDGASYRWFKIAPAIFAETHLPFDPLFQFLEYPLLYRDFIAGVGGSHKPENYFNYTDSLKKFEKLDRISQYMAEEQWIKQSQWPAAKVDTKIKTLRQQVEVISQDGDMNMYDTAVADYNRAVATLNEFIIYRNNQLLPSKPVSEVNEIFARTSSFLKSASERLDIVSRSIATLQLDIGDIRYQINQLKNKLQTQQAFYKNTVASAINKN